MGFRTLVIAYMCLSHLTLKGTLEGVPKFTLGMPPRTVKKNGIVGTWLLLGIYEVSVVSCSFMRHPPDRSPLD
jgi:hypothetical protein